MNKQLSFSLCFALLMIMVIPLTAGFSSVNSKITQANDRQNGEILRISVSSEKEQGYGDSDYPSISKNGRFIAFSSYAANLVVGDSNHTTDVFVHDFKNQTTEIVSIASDGSYGDGASSMPSISANGRYVSFFSFSTNLVNNDTNNRADIFVHDRQTGETQRVSLASDGSEANDGSSSPSISADGRYVVFESSADNLVNGDTNGIVDIFIFDRKTAKTQLVSADSNGIQANSVSWEPSISANGRFITFWSWADNLVDEDNNDWPDVFVRNRSSGETTIISVASDGKQGDNYSKSPVISANGRIIAFESAATTLVNGCSNGVDNIFVRDLSSGETKCVSVASNGTEGNHSSWYPSVSANGRYVAFSSWSDNLVANDTNNKPDIFVHDLKTGTTRLISIGLNGKLANNVSRYPSISGNGNAIAFSSYADNLVSDDTNSAFDIFLFLKR